MLRRTKGNHKVAKVCLELPKSMNLASKAIVL